MCYFGLQKLMSPPILKETIEFNTHENKGFRSISLFKFLCSIVYLSFLPGLKKWVEIGNSGIFRPEMLLPMGLPEDVVCIAWGLSLERYEYSY